MVSSKRPLFCLIDASSFIFRAFYAVRSLSNKSGLPTNAVFGFANMMLKVLEEMQPTHIAVIYDTKHPSFRKEMFADYKTNRSAMPEELVPQIPYVKKFVELLGLPAFERPGFEADDLIATFAHRAADLSNDHADVAIVSSDKDLMQLVGGRIYLYDTMKEQKFGPEQVKEKLGVFPELVPDYLGIVGDSSDNIPGVKGIGPKGAVALLEQFGSIEGIYERIAEVKKEGQRNQLLECKEQAILSKKLATVVRDLPIENDWHSLRCEPNPGEALFGLLQELEFHSLEKRLRAWNPAAKAGEPIPESAAPSVSSSDLVLARKKSYSGLFSAAELRAALAKIPAGAPVALDTETTGLEIHDAELVGISFCGDGANAYYLPLGHRDETIGNLLPTQCAVGEAVKILSDFLRGRKILGQNLKFDLNILRNAGLELDPSQVSFDSMIASYVLEPEARHGLDLLAEKYLQHKNISYAEVCGEGKAEISFALAPMNKAIEYAAEDAHVAFLLAEILEAKLAAEPGLKRVFDEIDMPLVPVLADIEWEGVSVDSPYLRKISVEFSQELKSLEKRSHEIAGGEFNLSSPKQLQKVLFEDLKLPPTKKTKTGFSTDVEVLEKLAPLHELPALILEHRELSKLQGTYVDVLPDLVSKKTNRLHAQFHQTVAATGRLSSSNPNLQNIPIRTQSGKRVRQAFIAKPGFFLLGADYSQIELRVLASMSGDEHLTSAFREGKDVHSQTASQIFGVSLKEVSEDLRRKAKAINFGLIYGKSAFSLAEELMISRAEASDIIKKYFEQYPTIRGFLDSLKEVAKEKGYAETLFGRRRAIEGIQSKNKMIMAMAERMAVNTPIQGTAADLVKIAMVRLWKDLRAHKLEAKLILQVHDELVVECPEKELDMVSSLVKKNMEGAGGEKLKVPLTVEIGKAKNWLEL